MFCINLLLSLATVISLFAYGINAKGLPSTIFANRSNLSSDLLEEPLVMMVTRKNYSHLEHPVGPYVHAASYNGLLFLSGVTAFDTPAQHGSIAAQAEAIFDQIEGILEAEKTGLDSLIKVTIFVTEFEDIDQLREVLFTRYKTHLPASSLVQVKRLFSPDLKIEVEAIVAVQKPN